MGRHGGCEVQPVAALASADDQTLLGKRSKLGANDPGLPAGGFCQLRNGESWLFFDQPKEQGA